MFKSRSRICAPETINQSVIALVDRPEGSRDSCSETVACSRLPGMVRQVRCEGWRERMSFEDICDVAGGPDLLDRSACSCHQFDV